MRPFKDFYAGKTVLITGHTGFKGSWLAAWLHHLGANVVGYALESPTNPSHFQACRLDQRIAHISGDVCDFESVSKVFKDHSPDILFHLAAQSLVRVSYREPRSTFNSNVMGTVNVLEAARRADSVSAAVVVTSDKCYKNMEWEWGYRETDHLGGHDPYSASKACAELVVASFQDKRFQKFSDPPSDLAIASGRAGNVIGGGDWAADRLIPDIVRAIMDQENIIVRHPNATRPWQHVLEALSGYLWLGAVMHTNRDLYCSAWNFGPTEFQMLPAGEVVQQILDKWSPPHTKLVVQPGEPGGEAMMLRVDCSKSTHHLRWHAAWRIEQTLDAIVEWYKRFYEDPSQDMCSYAVEQIERYTRCAQEQGIAWALPGQ